jgi:hypothetical protein
MLRSHPMFESDDSPGGTAPCRAPIWRPCRVETGVSLSSNRLRATLRVSPPESVPGGHGHSCRSCSLSCLSSRVLALRGLAPRSFPAQATSTMSKSASSYRRALVRCIPRNAALFLPATCHWSHPLLQRPRLPLGLSDAQGEPAEPTLLRAWTYQQATCGSELLCRRIWPLRRNATAPRPSPRFLSQPSESHCPCTRRSLASAQGPAEGQTRDSPL